MHKHLQFAVSAETFAAYEESHLDLREFAFLNLPSSDICIDANCKAGDAGNIVEIVVYCTKDLEENYDASRVWNDKEIVLERYIAHSGADASAIIASIVLSRSSDDITV